MPVGAVSGSVIQRTFVGADLPEALFAASVPLSEVGNERTDFNRLVSEIIAVPSNALLDDSQYRALAHQLTTQDWPRRWLRYAPSPYWEEWAPAWERREQDLVQEMQSREGSVRLFAEHSVALMLSGDRQLAPYWFGGPLFPDEFRRRLGVEMDEAAFGTGVACLSARLQRSERASRFTKAVLNYDLPHGNSPRASSDSLLRLLDSGKKMCLAPMAAGGTYGIAQLSQGHYVAAILSVGTGSVMTLILLGSVAVGSLLVARLAQRRAEAQGPPTVAA